MKPLLNEYFIDKPLWKVYTANELTMDGVNLYGIRKKKALFEVRWHHHPDLFEFHLFQDGTYTFEVEDKTHTANGGMVFITLPDELHKGEFAIPGGHQFYWFQLRTSGRFLGLSEEKSARLREELLHIKHRCIPFTSTMETAIKKSFERSCSNDPFEMQFAENQLASFLYQLLEQDRNMDTTERSPEICRAIEYMQQNLHQQIDMPSVASFVGMSDSFFRTKFKKEIGVSPVDYYTGLRIERAKELLGQGYSVTETANALDFSTPNYFATVFRKSTNISPTDYKKQEQ